MADLSGLQRSSPAAQDEGQVDAVQFDSNDVDGDDRISGVCRGDGDDLL